MRRTLACLLVLFLLLPMLLTRPAATAAQTNDADAAAATAVELSRLESIGDANGLYDRIHPDAHAIIPRAAIIGWYQTDFIPLGPGVATVTGVRFIEWTWPVTGQVYAFTAEVSFRQPFADGSVADEVVRLVQDARGEWRWFFGRSAEFVQTQIDRFVPVVPALASGSIIDVVATDLNGFWDISFSASGRVYSPPGLVFMTGYTSTPCGGASPNDGPAFYCPGNQSVYVSPDWFASFEYQIGDFAWITIMAHEWGHHVQFLDSVRPGPGSGHELQADCLAGSYARDAETRQLLEPGDVTEAVTISAISGDPFGLPQDAFGLHGTSDERVTAFFRGYLDGFLGCGFLTTGGGMPSAPVTRAVDAASLLPTTSDVPAGMVLVGEGRRNLADVAINYTDPLYTQNLFASLGWTENVTRSFEGADGSVYASIHRFGSAGDAAIALDHSLLDQAASTGAVEIAVPPLGQYARALATGADVTIYVQQGDVVIRLTVSGPPQTALSAAVSIMTAIVARAG